MGIASVEQWIAALQAAFRDALAQRTGTANLPSLYLWASPCAMHPGCAWVIYGAYVEHVQWQQTDPIQLADQMIRKMLPGGP